MDAAPTHGRRPSQAYRPAGRNLAFSPLARYLQLGQSVGFWSSLLFVCLYVFDFGILFFSPSSSPSASPPFRSNLSALGGGPTAGDAAAAELRPAEPADYPPQPLPKYGDEARDPVGPGPFSCFGKPCSAEDREYATRAFAGLAKSPFYKNADVHRLRHVPADFMLYDCSPPSPPRLDPPEDFPDVRSLPWLTSVHQYLAHQSELCLTAVTHDAGEESFVGRLNPPRYLGDRMCRALATSKDERERLEGLRCMDSDTTYRTLQKVDVDEEGEHELDSGPLGPQSGELADGGAAGDFVNDDGGTEEALVLTDADEELRDSSVRDLDSIAYHAPIVAGLRDAFVSPAGHVYTGKQALVPSGSCRPESIRSASPGSAKSVRGRVFVISQPHDPRDPHSTLLDSLPRLAVHHSALVSNEGEGILIHHSGGALTEQVLGLLDIPAERLVEGDVRADVVYLPEPSVRCGIPPPYQASLLRDILRRRLVDGSPNVRRLPSQGIVLIVQGGPDPASDARIANAGRLQDRLKSEFPDKKVILLRSRPGRAPRSARGTLALFHLAEVVIAPRGPQLSFLLAAAPRTAVLEIVPDAASPTGRQPSPVEAEPPSPLQHSGALAPPAPSLSSRDPAVPGKYADLARSLGLEYYATAARYVEGYRDVPPAVKQAASPAGSDASSAEDACVESGLYVDVDKVRAVVGRGAL